MGVHLKKMIVMNEEEKQYTLDNYYYIMHIDAISTAWEKQNCNSHTPHVLQLFNIKYLYFAP